MTLELDYDVNRIASIELEVRVLWDPTLARIALRFGNAERGTARRISIADNVFLDVDDERALREIRLRTCSSWRTTHRTRVDARTTTHAGITSADDQDALLCSRLILQWIGSTAGFRW